MGSGIKSLTLLLILMLTSILRSTMETRTRSLREAKRCHSCQTLALAGQSMMIQRGMYGLFFAQLQQF